MKNWQLQDAKARLSELVKCAAANNPQIISVHGKSTVVVISKLQYDQLTKPKISLLQLLRNSPFVGVNLKIKRDKSPARDIDL